MNGRNSSWYATVLWFLTALFSLRVAGQTSQRWFPLAALPPFENFQGSNLPYAVLLGVQLVILLLMTSAAWRVGKGVLARRPMAAKFLHGFAAVYFSGSVLRILASALYPNALPWFTAWIPAFFHLVLASFVWTMALCYAEKAPGHREDTQWSHYVIYPFSVSCAFALFAVLRAHGVALSIALYVTIIANAVWILILERWFPEREDWHPNRGHVQADALYIALVQVALPKLLTMGVVLFLASHTHRPAFWPHDWHWAAQTLLMILVVDLMRYWVHRACHHFPALWRLHEVHHSPRLLYSMNTSRFHPI